MYLETIKSLRSQLHQESEKLLKELSKIDKEVNDLTHVVEFSICNASEGYKIYKKLQESLKKRRKVKDEIAYIKSIATSLKAKGHNKSVKNRHYEVRIMKDVLGDKIESNLKVTGMF